MNGLGRDEGDPVSGDLVFALPLLHFSHVALDGN